MNGAARARKIAGMNIAPDPKSLPADSILSPEANKAAALAAASGVLTIDLDALVANWRKLEKTAVPAECSAVIKANAYGCGVAIEAPGADIPIRTLRNIARNPNFGGRAMVVSLGCEKLQPQRLFPQGSIQIKGADGPDLVCLQDSAHVGFASMIDSIMRTAEKHLIELNKRRRETCPASDLVVGVLFVTATGLGPFAGVMAIAVNTGGVLGKLFAEAVEAIDKGPVEGVRATGGAPIHESLWGIIPQVAPLWTSYALYRFESSSRAATVLGLIGAGGIGQLLFDSLNAFAYAQTATIVIVIVVTVSLIDLISQTIRTRLL